MKFIIGIGNPGKAYTKTRHNIGFEILDTISGGVKFKKDPKLKALIVLLENKTLGLVKPETFVNLTGETASTILSRYKLEAKDILIVCDDVNLPFGKIRFRASGSAGGHNGLKSVIEKLGTNDFSRLRIGVGNEKMPKDLSKFVLEEFSKEEKKELPEVVKKAALVCESWALKGLEAAMTEVSKVNS